jgi:hypothetical protein
MLNSGKKIRALRDKEKWSFPKEYKNDRETRM